MRPELHASLISLTRPARRMRARPAIGDGRRISLPGGVAATSWGSGPAVVLVHGWKGRGSQFQDFLAPLVRSGLRPVAVDAPAHGDSRAPAFTPVLYGRAVLDVAELLGPVRAVISHSLGSASVLSAVRRGLCPRRLVFLAPVRSYSAEVEKLAATHNIDRDYLLRYVSRVFGQSLTELDAEAWAPDVTTLLCHDVGDGLIPIDSTRLLARAWPTSRLVETSGLGHHGILRDSAVIATVVEELAG